MQPLETAQPPHTQKFHWRLMRPQDMEAVCAIAADCHPDLPERAAVLAEKQRLAPASCLILANADTKAVSGYILAHPWADGAIPRLDCFLRALPAETDILYLHDLALDKTARGRGLAGLGVRNLCAYAQKAGFTAVSLTAVHHSAPFWQAQGFAAYAHTGNESLAASLAPYGADARFMVKNL